MTPGVTAPVFLTGGSGLLAVNWAVAIRDRCPVVLGTHRRPIRLAGVSARRVTLESVAELTDTLKEIGPRLVVHAAGMTNVDACEQRPDDAQHVNVELAANVAHACASLDLPLVHISTDHFVSEDTAFAVEEQPVSPVNVYGRTKADGEKRVREAHPPAIIARTNFYGWGPSYRRSFSDTIIDTLRKGESIRLFRDVSYTPILASVLVDAVHDLVDSGASGIFHVSGDECLTKYEFGLRIADRFGLDRTLINGGLLHEAGLAPRPRGMSLSNKKTASIIGRPLGGVDEHLDLLWDQEASGMAVEIQQIGSVSSGSSLN
ncbi:MAG TPA: SDR family oxidoreductase [Gemmatimonadaceae bacterium]|nr:SDR family oxidoreductase [Gemmatimonadaceae bacterium]